MLALFIAAALTQTPQHRLFQQPNLPRQTAPTPCVESIDCALQAGDKSGSWWALKANGMMATSSALTQTNVGGGGTSPMTFNGTDQYYRSATVAYPTGDFSVVVVFRLDSGAGTCELAAKWGGSDISFSIEIVPGTGVGHAYVKSSTGNLGDAAFGGATFEVDTWYGVALTYTTATGAIKGRTSSTNVTATATGGGVLAQSERHTVGAHAVPDAFMKGKSRGVFFTEKVLSDADIDRIVAGAM